MTRIDVHNHFLPAVDDGCKTPLESITCLRAFWHRGYTKFFVTPHTGAMEFGDIQPAQVVSHLEMLRKFLVADGIAVQLRPGGELRLSPRILSLPDTSRIPTFGLNTPYVLVDLWEPDWPWWADECVDWLQAHGLTVILAHPERMDCLRLNPDFIDALADRDLLFQGNLGPLGGSEGEDGRGLAERYLLEHRYFMLGSDCHRPDHLPSRLGGLRRAVDLVGQEKVDELTITNPGKLWV